MNSKRTSLTRPPNSSVRIKALPGDLTPVTLSAVVFYDKAYIFW